MKKIVGIFLALALLVGSFAGCKGNSGDKLSIVTTIFPEYDWVNQILGEQAQNAEVTLLLDSGVDLHSYQPTADDIVTISTCDMFIYVGGHSDDWVDDFLLGFQIVYFILRDETLVCVPPYDITLHQTI